MSGIILTLFFGICVMLFVGTRNVKLVVAHPSNKSKALLLQYYNNICYTALLLETIHTYMLYTAM